MIKAEKGVNGEGSHCCPKVSASLNPELDAFETISLPSHLLENLCGKSVRPPDPRHFQSIGICRTLIWYGTRVEQGWAHDSKRAAAIAEEVDQSNIDEQCFSVLAQVS